jgi:hypothetical protein
MQLSIVFADMWALGVRKFNKSADQRTTGLSEGWHRQFKMLFEADDLVLQQPWGSRAEIVSADLAPGGPGTRARVLTC